MLNDKQLAALLLKLGIVSNKGLRNARERQHNVEGENLEESLLFLGLVDYRKLGEVYAHHYQLPYAPVFQANIPAELKNRFPLPLVRRLRFLPMRLKERKLELVTCQPDNPELRERFEYGQPVDWRVASRTELEDAIRAHYLGKKIQREKQEIKLPFEFRILDHPTPEKTGAATENSGAGASAERKRVILIEPDHHLRHAIVTLLDAEGYRVTAVIDSDEALKELHREDAVYILQRRTFLTRSRELERLLQDERHQAELRYFGTISGLLLGDELSPEELFRNYLSSVKLLVGGLTRQDPGIIQNCHLMAHYARLLATGLGLKRKTQEGLLLAIYLKEIGPYAGEPPEAAENNILPLLPAQPYAAAAAALKKGEDSFGLAGIIEKIDHPGKESPLEARIITLLNWLLATFGSAGGQGLIEIDAEHFQQSLRENGSRNLDPQLAEELFQIISHEQRLTGRGRNRGTILVLDPSFEREQSELHTRLIRESYEPVILNRADQARFQLRQQPARLVISELAGEDYDGPAFCRELKQKQPELPFVFFSGETREEEISRALQAGADDFISKKESPQVAFLKINRLIARNRNQETTVHESGVSGSLEEMGFMETIQILANREKDALISLRSPGGTEARVYLHQGEIIHACCGRLEGENAIYELLGWQKGFFQVTTPSRLPERNVFGSTEAIMLEGCRLLDEHQRENHELLPGG